MDIVSELQRFLNYKIKYTSIDPHGFVFGKDKNRIDFLICALTHGNEVIGLQIINLILKKIEERSLKFEFNVGFLLNHVEAAEQNKRFLEKDLNRSFKKETPGKKEEVRAKQIEKIVDSAEFIFDLHQTTEATPHPFIIIPESENLIRKAYAFAPDLQIVTFPAIGFSKEGATLIEYAFQRKKTAMVIEVSQNGFNDSIADFFADRIISYLMNRRKSVSLENSEINYYHICDVIPQSEKSLQPGFKNFTAFQKGMNLTENYKALFDGIIVFPKYGALAEVSQELAELAIVKKVKAFELNQKPDLQIEPRLLDLGGFEVRRVLPFSKRRMVGPFIFLDHMGPADFKPDDKMTVRAHPHIGLSTLTYLFEGRIHHRDSLGTSQVIQAGDVNWMTAGKGISHSERSPEDDLQANRRLHGLQFWVALPEKNEDDPPIFFHYAKKEIPRSENQFRMVDVIVGHYEDLVSPVKTISPTLFLQFKIKQDYFFEFETGLFEVGVYFISGEKQNQMIVYPEQSLIQIKFKSDDHFVVIGGESLRQEKHIWWNFVSSSQEKIQEAKKNWNEGRFPMVPGEVEKIKAPEN